MKKNTLNQRQRISAYYADIDKIEKELTSFVTSEVEKAGELPLVDENNDNDRAVRLSVVGDDNDYVFNPTFDRIKAVKEGDVTKLKFHVKDGNDWAEDNSWIGMYNFSANDEWKFLIDYIEWQKKA